MAQDDQDRVGGGGVYAAEGVANRGVTKQQNARDMCNTYVCPTRKPFNHTGQPAGLQTPARATAFKT